LLQKNRWLKRTHETLRLAGVVGRLALADIRVRPRRVASAVTAVALTAIKDQPGVADAVGLTPATVFVPYPGNDNAAGVAVTGGSLSAVLNLKVISDSLNGFGPGDIALSRLETGKSAVDVSVGQAITAYLPDGTPYRAKVTAIYDRSLGFGDVVIPASAAGASHLGMPHWARSWSAPPSAPLPRPWTSGWLRLPPGSPA
jgi:hypothetical protein